MTLFARHLSLVTLLDSLACHSSPLTGISRSANSTESGTDRETSEGRRRETAPLILRCDSTRRVLPGSGVSLALVGGGDEAGDLSPHLYLQFAAKLDPLNRRAGESPSSARGNETSECL